MNSTKKLEWNYFAVTDIKTNLSYPDALKVLLLPFTSLTYYVSLTLISLGLLRVFFLGGQFDLSPSYFKKN